MLLNVRLVILTATEIGLSFICPMRHKLSMVISCFLFICLPLGGTSQVALSKAEKNQKKRQAIATYSQQTNVTITTKLESDLKVTMYSIFDVESVGLTSVSGSLLLTLPETERGKLKEAFAVSVKKFRMKLKSKIFRQIFYLIVSAQR